jgi:hypothetical protein
MGTTCHTPMHLIYVQVLDNSPKYGQPCVVEILQIEVQGSLMEGTSMDMGGFPGRKLKQSLFCS